jgi:ribonuclease BN (tRNA processing enzyme)
MHDAQYLPSDMPAKHGWGHSLVQHACQLAVAAEGKHLILFHHDPVRTDDRLDAIQEETRAWLQTQHRHMQCTAAYEGLVVDIGGPRIRQCRTVRRQRQCCTEYS